MLFSDSIRLMSNVFIFDLIHTIWIKFQSSLGESHIGQGVSKNSNTEIMEYLTILIIEIGFGENILSNKKREVKNDPYPSLSSGNPILLTKKTKKA